MIGSGDCDRVDLFLLENVAKILIDARRIAQLALCVVRELLHDRGVNIAHICNASSVFVCLQRGKVSVGTAVEADDRKVKAIIGTHDLAVALCSRTYCQSCRSYSKGVKKFASSNHESISISGHATCRCPAWLMFKCRSSKT